MLVKTAGNAFACLTFPARFSYGLSQYYTVVMIHKRDKAWQPLTATKQFTLPDQTRLS